MVFRRFARPCFPLVAHHDCRGTWRSPTCGVADVSQSNATRVGIEVAGVEAQNSEPPIDLSSSSNVNENGRTHIYASEDVCRGA
jgi:hypothetical protein